MFTRSRLFAACIAMLLLWLGGWWLLNRPPYCGPHSHEHLVAREETKALRESISQANPFNMDLSYQQVNDAQPDMVYIPGGHYLRGTLPIETNHTLVSNNESPAEEVFVEDFYIDRFEFPNIKGKPPVTKVAWSRAKETCISFGKRLCTADEWEKACKGPGNQVYGIASTHDSWDEDICSSPNYNTLGSKEDCRSGYNVYNLSGGVYEWTSTPRIDTSDRYIVKGGDKSTYPEMAYRCAFGRDHRGEYGAADSGMSFRCCKSLDGQQQGASEHSEKEDSEVVGHTHGHAEDDLPAVDAKAQWTVDFGQPDIIGEGSQASVEAVVRSNKGHIEYCYEKASNNNPNLSGKVEIEFSIARGRVLTASVFGNTTGNSAVADCIKRKIKAWSFDSDIEMEVVYPILLLK